MHANLIVTQNENQDNKILELSKKLNAKIMEFPIQKIEDTRNLNNLIRLSFKEPTLIVCKNIENATTEALNAFLKNLEEPGQNIFFALTTSSIRKVLPTIVSRCQIIKESQNTEYAKDEKIEGFAKSSVGKKFLAIEKIKERIDAIKFVENLIGYYHNQLHVQPGSSFTSIAKNSEVATQTLNNLKANGNVSLQLSALVANLI